MQESKEALERLRRMGAFEAQDFDITVSHASALHTYLLMSYLTCVLPEYL